MLIERIMSETRPPYIVDNTPDPATNLERLTEVLGVDYTNLLIDLLVDVKSTTGYGAVEIIVAAGRVQSIKMVRSYRS